MRGLLIAIRLAAMIAWLALCIPLHLLFHALFRKRSIAPIFLGGISLIIGLQIDTRDARAGQRTILLANHVSWMDIPIIAAVAGSAFVAHDGLADSRFLKWLCEMNDTVFIARNRRATVARQVDQVREALDRSHVLTLFPEGTTNDGRTLLPLKSALLSAIDPPPPGVAVQPVFLDYGEDAADIAWVGDEPGLANFMRILGRTRPLRVAVHFLPPLTGPQLEGRKTIAAAVEQAFQTANGVR